ncbi:uncharacterized protein LOC132713328 isoform X2 [Ruditapes philippinarum]|nr:uncharacterized protein LOC132713328 isoform X2 [Ruditapes philippinarum]
MLKTKDVIKTNTVVENILHENCIEMTIPRVSFAQNIQLQFSLTLDVPNKQYKAGEEFLIIAEIIYTGWRNKNISQYIEGFPGYLNISKGKEWKRLCGCIDGKYTQCRCTTENKCNGIIDNITCVDCNYPWLCVKTLPGYGMRSMLKDDNGDLFICATARRYTKPSDRVHCYHRKGNDTIERIQSSVSIILGRDEVTGSLYGISQNGLAYMTSMDDGIKWYSIHPNQYARAKQSFRFKMATLS